MDYINLQSPEVIGKVVKNLNGRPYRIVDNVDRKSSNNVSTPPVIALDLGNGDWERFYYDGKPEIVTRSPLNLFEEPAVAALNLKMIVGRTYITSNFTKVICEQLNSFPFSFSLFGKSYEPNTYKVTVIQVDAIGSNFFRESWNVRENGEAVDFGAADIIDFYNPSAPKYYWVYVPNTSDGVNTAEPWKEVLKWKGYNLGSSSENNWQGFISFDSRPLRSSAPAGYSLMQVAMQETRFDIEEFKLLSSSDSPPLIIPSAWSSPFGTLNIQGWNLTSSSVSSLGNALNTSYVMSSPVHSVSEFYIAQVEYPTNVWIQSIDTLNCEFGYSEDGTTFVPSENDNQTEFFWEYSLNGVSWTKFGSSFNNTKLSEEAWSATKDYSKDTVVNYFGAKFKALFNISGGNASAPIWAPVTVSSPYLKGTVVKYQNVYYVAKQDITYVFSNEKFNPALWLALPATPVQDTFRWSRQPSTTKISATVNGRYFRLVLKPKPDLIPNSPPVSGRRYFARLNSIDIKLLQS